MGTTSKRKTKSTPAADSSRWKWIGVLVPLIAIGIGLYYTYLRKSAPSIPPMPEHHYEPFINPRLQTPRKYPDDLLIAYTEPEPLPENEGYEGEMGNNVRLSKKKQKEGVQRFKEHGFNVVASEMLHMNRSLPDYRSDICIAANYPSKLPNTSIIIVFHNEAWSTLLRTVWSIITRSPRELLHEIILVDDASIPEELGAQLDAYVAELPVPTRVLRQQPRGGLMKARLMGAEAATGATLTFLDAHCECVVGWLPPLLARIAHSRHSVPSPTIDIIDEHTFEYRTIGQRFYGGVSQHFVFDWVEVPPREWQRIGDDRTLPLRQPVMAGGLFSIDRAFFYEIGSYDAQMRTWGAENLDMALRIWMCGGENELLLCSRVGHVYRDMTPYEFPGGSTPTIQYNMARVADVWFDEYSEMFYEINPIDSEIRANHGDLSERFALRERLQCKGFDWFIKNIYPEAPIYPHMLYRGPVVNPDSGLCWDSWSGSTELRLTHCHHQGGNQYFLYLPTKQFKAGDQCLLTGTDTARPDGAVRVGRCQEHDASQQFTLVKRSRHLVSAALPGYCLTAETDNGYEPGVNVVMVRKCGDVPGQRWAITLRDEAPAA